MDNNYTRCIGRNTVKEALANGAVNLEGLGTLGS